MSYAKTAFVVGVMFTFGKYVGGELAGATEMVVKGALRQGAKNGNEYAQIICDKAGIEYSEPTMKNAVIGFKAD